MQAGKTKPSLARRFRRRIISFIIFAVVLWGAYRWIREAASTRVRNEMVRLAEVLDLSEGEKVVVRDYIAKAHPSAFDRALDLTNTGGSRFRAVQYYEEVFESVIAQSGAAGLEELATKLNDQRERVAFSVAEK